MQVKVSVHLGDGHHLIISLTKYQEFPLSEGQDACLFRPCINGGSCARNKNGYVCHCKSSFDGVKCEHKQCKCIRLT